MTTYTYIAGRAKYAASSAQKTGGVTLGGSAVDATYSNGTTTNTTAIAINVNSLLNKGTNALTGNALAKAMTTVLQFQSNVVGNKSASLKAGSDTYQYTAVKMFTTDSAVPTAPTVKVSWTVGATTADAYIGLSFLRTQDVTVTTGSSIGAGTHFDASFLTTGKLTFVGGSATVLMDVVGGQANDTITGGTGGDSLTGGLGDDVITGGDGADTVDGGTGTDTYIAGGSATAISVTLNTSTAATVTVTSGNGNDSIKNIENVTGTTGNDSVTGDSAANVLSGLAGSDTLSGGSGADSISGGNDADSLVGGSGDDTLNGGTGNDTMAGGVGIDTFLFAAGDTGTPSDTTFDTIVDYTIGSDVIDFGSTSISQFNTVTAAAAGTAGVSSAGAVTFDSTDSSLASRVTAVKAAMAANTTAGKALIFGVSSDAYVYISDSVAGAGANDVLIKLAGVTVGGSTDTFIIDGGDIVSLA